MENRDIVYYSIPLKTDVVDIKEGLSDSEKLHDAIVQYSSELAEKDIETWVIDRNMIITEDGYKVAFYSKSAELKYQEKCEIIIKHLVTLIINKKLQKHFSPTVIQDALHVKNLYNGRI